MTAPKLSIITVNLNDRDGLRKTLTSIGEQTWKQFEIHVQDGGSTDGSREVMEEFSSLLTSSVSEKDDGIYDAQNRGLARSKGEYVIFLNSGDWLKQPDSLELFFADDPTEDLLYGDVYFCREGEQPYRKENQEKLGALFLILDTLCHQVQVIRRSVFEELGGYETKYPIVADYEFLLRALIQNRKSYRYIPVPLAVADQSGISSRPEMADPVWNHRQEIQAKTWDPLTLNDLLRIPTLEHEIKVLKHELESIKSAPASEPPAARKNSPWWKWKSRESQ